MLWRESRDEAGSEAYSIVSSGVHNFCIMQVLDPTKRLGCDKMGGYEPLKSHVFFEGIYVYLHNLYDVVLL